MINKVLQMCYLNITIIISILLHEKKNFQAYLYCLYNYILIKKDFN